MRIKAGHRHVGNHGLVFLPYLHSWNAQCTLAELVSTDHGPSSIASAYEKCTAFPRGTRIQWKDPKSESIHSGEVEGLGASGELLVRIPARGVIPLYAEDIRAVRKAADGFRP